ncbi:MAG: hypothetical protein A3E37_02335 [Candidatus Andersenbacteria bacterium RIFCSPHIGHO2_12_FULL_46_9]|nr:MAG: hypothetical protein UW94_C0011G0042 [Parcubacteria group bacterium GW2011_GWA2_45_14]OGY34586.1 MAG: hypothetical protein A3B76_06370 [Candidatus Andersenbacteria bacterium RIFCSPHIGHO2_02_FULL_46_16]OGY36378.1 MAG: hypothetical protein A3E37_02335 [Candidatus Andersenbacteria bacterium RIFCSPHIGHO2_12_FULL_46_9]OGY37871.1 MAG: hypothetical protein A3I08_01625 [Candidatus Andersenbacteria bacterium RIFCSPLOWO2_02_FULL_46_11]OGY42667.1 MAG: hypothetical protein A3G57_03465 [Candidatus A
MGLTENRVYYHQMPTITIKLNELRQINCGTSKAQKVRLLILLPASVLITKHEVAADDKSLYETRIAWSTKTITKGGNKYYRQLFTPILDDIELSKAMQNLTGSSPDQEQILNINEEGFIKVPYEDITNISFHWKILVADKSYVSLSFKDNIDLPQLNCSLCELSPWGVKNIFFDTKLLYKKIKSRMENKQS